jgi:hypothetical protein
MVTNEKPQIVQPEQKTNPNLELLTSDKTESEQPFQTEVDALRAGAIDKVTCDKILKAESDYGVARQRFVDGFNAIKHEQIAHNSENLPEVIKTADATLKEYNRKVDEMNSLLREHNIKTRSAVDGSMFDDDSKKIKLDQMVSRIGLASVRQELKELGDQADSPEPTYIDEQSDNNSAA